MYGAAVAKELLPLSLRVGGREPGSDMTPDDPMAFKLEVGTTCTINLALKREGWDHLCQ